MDDQLATESFYTAARLFAMVWETMADVLGTAATATLVRRSARRAAERYPELAALTVSRAGFDYGYRLPESWHTGAAAGLPALCALVRALSPLLVELTGPVILRRLRAIPELARCEISFEEHGQ